MSVNIRGREEGGMEEKEEGINQSFKSHEGLSIAWAARIPYCQSPTSAYGAAKEPAEYKSWKYWGKYSVHSLAVSKHFVCPAPFGCFIHVLFNPYNCHPSQE